MKTTGNALSLIVAVLAGASFISPSLLHAQITVGGNGSNATDGTSYTGNQSLTKIGSNTVTLTAGSSYSGGTFVNEGTLAAQGPNDSTSSLGTGDITINSGGTIRVESSNAMGYASGRTLTINSGGVLTNNGTASQQLNAVLLNGGTIAGSASGGDAAIYGSYAIPYGVATGGSSDTSVISAPNIVLTQQGGTVFNIASGATNGIDLLVSGFIAVPSGAVGFTTGLIKQGQGVMVLAGNNTYTEGTTIAAGTLRLSGSNASSTYGIAAGAVLDINQTNTGALQTFSGGTYTGSGTLRKTGAGVFTWRDAAAINLDSSAVVDVQEGTLQASFAANQIWANNQSSLNVASGAVFDVDAAAVRFGGLTGSGTVRLGLAGSFPLQKLTIGVADASSTFGGSIVNGSSSAPLEKVGTGTITLTGTNTYTGTTTVSAGELNVNGSIASSAVTVQSGASLSGSGVVGVISGAGSVDPGNSPGILTAPAVDPSGGLTFNFEFTSLNPVYSNASASLNDVLRLTDTTTPFVASLTSVNAVNIFFNVATFEAGQLYTGGFFTDVSTDFLDELVDATFNYYVSDAGGSVSYGGENYRALGEGLSITLSTVSASGDFAGGTVNGQVMQLEVVPEPSTYALLVLGAAGLAAQTWRRRRRSGN